MPYHTSSGWDPPNRVAIAPKSRSSYPHHLLHFGAITGQQHCSPRVCVSATNAGSDSRPRKDGPSDHSTMLSTNSAAVAQRRVTVAGRGDRPPALVGGRPRASPRMTEVEARGPHSVAEVATASAAWRHRVRRRGKPHLRQSSCGGCGSSRRCQGRPVRRHPAVETASVGYEGNLSRRAPQSNLLDPVYIVGPKNT